MFSGLRVSARSRLSVRIILLLIAVSSVVSSPGCRKNVYVSGRVTYENGQPLSIGQIVFTDDYHMGRSDIDKNGEYSIHSFRRNDGIPKGTYKVYITGAILLSDSGSTGIEGMHEIKSESLIDFQHTNPDASGWVFKLEKDTTINLVVYPPNQVPDDVRTDAARYMLDPEFRKKVDRSNAHDDSIHSESIDASRKRKRLVNPTLL